MKRPSLLLVAGAAVVLLVLWFFARWDAQISQGDQATIAAAQQWLQAGKARRLERGHLLAVALNAMTKATALQREAQVHAAGDRQLDAALGRARAAVESLSLVVAQRDSARAAVTNWAQAFASLMVARLADSTRADRAEAALAEGERHLTDVVIIADCHLLGVGFLPRCPSRTVSLVVGGIVGAGAAVVALH